MDAYTRAQVYVCVYPCMHVYVYSTSLYMYTDAPRHTHVESDQTLDCLSHAPSITAPFPLLISRKTQTHTTWCSASRMPGAFTRSTPCHTLRAAVFFASIISKSRAVSPPPPPPCPETWAPTSPDTAAPSPSAPALLPSFPLASPSSGCALELSTVVTT